MRTPRLRVLRLRQSKDGWPFGCEEGVDCQFWVIFICNFQEKYKILVLSMIVHSNIQL